MYSRSLSALDFTRRFFVSCTQISEAYAVRTLMKFGAAGGKSAVKSKCRKDSESTFYTIPFFPVFIQNRGTAGKQPPGLLPRKPDGCLFHITVMLSPVFQSSHRYHLFVITSGGTIRRTSLPAEITRSPFSIARLMTSPTGQPVTTRPCIKPFPRRAARQSYFSTSSSSFFSRYGAVSATCSTTCCFS